mgnify:CR=1 FL=1
MQQMNGEIPMRTLKNFEKIAVKKKPANDPKKTWKLNRKSMRKGKLIMQEKIYA